MKRAILLIALLYPVSLFAQRVDARVSLIIRESNLHLRSNGIVEYYNAFGSIDYSMTVDVSHYIKDMGSGKTIAGTTYAFPTVGTYLKTIESSVTAYPRGCWNATIIGRAEDRAGTYGREDQSFCALDNCCGSAPPPSGCTTDPETGQQTCTGGSGGGGVGSWNTQDCGYNNVEQGGCASPIVINPASSKYTLSGEDDPVLFDLDANGTRDIVTWIGRDSGVALLALDRNGNGAIDDGAELFGNHTPLPSGATAQNGFVALAAYDANGDGMIDSWDPIWSSLLLWTDRNHDAHSSPDEILPISQSPITGVELDYQTVGRHDEFGNYFRFKGMARIGNVRRPIYDVFLRINQ